jgi:hypothetical protein
LWKVKCNTWLRTKGSNTWTRITMFLTWGTATRGSPKLRLNNCPLWTQTPDTCMRIWWIWGKHLFRCSLRNWRFALLWILDPRRMIWLWEWLESTLKNGEYCAWSTRITELCRRCCRSLSTSTGKTPLTKRTTAISRLCRTHTNTLSARTSSWRKNSAPYSQTWTKTSTKSVRSSTRVSPVVADKFICRKGICKWCMRKSGRTEAFALQMMFKLAWAGWASVGGHLNNRK